MVTIALVLLFAAVIGFFSFMPWWVLCFALAWIIIANDN